MGKYSKAKLKGKRLIPIVIVVLSLILILSISGVIYINVTNNIVIQKVDNAAQFVSDDVALKATPIVVDNVVVGAVYDKKWVSTEKYYVKNSNKANIDTDVYISTGKAGKFSLNNFKKEANSLALFTTTTSLNKIDEYFAITPSETNVMPKPAVKAQITNKDFSDVRRALGVYNLLNSTIKVNEVYEVTLGAGNTGRIISATSESKNIFGVYSIVIFVDGNKPRVIKYNYIKDVKNASSWPIYSLKFVADLNADGSNDIILQETTEFNVKYDVIEYRNDNFYEVLSSEIKI